jgi:hypothetical protein
LLIGALPIHSLGERDMNGMEAVPRSAPSIHARQTTDAMP